ncbi:unnamed protein product, partial [Amoebophrya sp. A25]
ENGENDSNLRTAKGEDESKKTNVKMKGDADKSVANGGKETKVQQQDLPAFLAMFSKDELRDIANIGIRVARERQHDAHSWSRLPGQWQQPTSPTKDMLPVPSTLYRGGGGALPSREMLEIVVALKTLPGTVRDLQRSLRELSQIQADLQVAGRSKSSASSSASSATEASGYGPSKQSASGLPAYGGPARKSSSGRRRPEGKRVQHGESRAGDVRDHRGSRRRRRDHAFAPQQNLFGAP